jgi:hypothetical protein
MKRRRKIDPDSRVLEMLENFGSDFSKEHEFVFFLYFPSKDIAETVQQQLLDKGFEVDVHPPHPGSSWLVLAMLEMRPTHIELVKLRKYFTKLAQSYDGNYDGWETPIMNDK